MEVKEKYIIGFDTICDGNQTALDENKLPVLYDSEPDAFFELFCDAIAGLEGTDDDYFEENELDKDKLISEMEELKEEGDFFKMREWLEANPSANYYDEFIESAEDFVLGRKAIFTGKGIVIEGTKLEEL